MFKTRYKPVNRDILANEIEEFRNLTQIKLNMK
jgi:hypothetical protein